MAFTPRYGWPYQAGPDRPNGPVLGEALAKGIEATVGAIDTRLVAAEAAVAPLAPGFTDYSASLAITGSVTNPTKGNSTYNAEYKTVAGIVTFNFKITIGSTFAIGSGLYAIGLPVLGSTLRGAAATGVALVSDSGVAVYTAGMRYSNPAVPSAIYLFLNGAGTALGSGGPGTAWATNDELQGTFIYPAA